MSTADQLDFFGAGRHQPRFSVRESGRAKRLSIQVAAHGDVEVVVPKNTSARRVSAFVESNRRWIDQTLAAFAKEYDPQEFALPSRIELVAIGESYDVSYRQTQSPDVSYKCYGSHLVLSGNVSASDLCRQQLKNWLRQRGKATLAPWLAKVSSETGLDYKRAQVRGQRTRWGSCSIRGTISLNWGLLFISPKLVRYLFVHELCHTVHLNHSKRFWALVRQFDPEFKAHDRLLDESWRQVPGWARI